MSGSLSTVPYAKIQRQPPNNGEGRMALVQLSPIKDVGPVTDVESGEPSPLSGASDVTTSPTSLTLEEINEQKSIAFGSLSAVLACQSGDDALAHQTSPLPSDDGVPQLESTMQPIAQQPVSAALDAATAPLSALVQHLLIRDEQRQQEVATLRTETAAKIAVAEQQVATLRTEMTANELATAAKIAANEEAAAARIARSEMKISTLTSDLSATQGCLAELTKEYRVVATDVEKTLKKVDDARLQYVGAASSHAEHVEGEDGNDLAALQSKCQVLEGTLFLKDQLGMVVDNEKKVMLEVLRQEKRKLQNMLLTLSEAKELQEEELAKLKTELHSATILSKMRHAEVATLAEEAHHHHHHHHHQDDAAAPEDEG